MIWPLFSMKADGKKVLKDGLLAGCGKQSVVNKIIKEKVIM